MTPIHIQIDELLQKRQSGYLDFVRSSKQLNDMGVRLGNQNTGELTVPNSFAKYLDRFERSNLEFEWEVEYTDGTKLAQFEGTNEHNFKHIDKSKIKSISFISNFDWQTDNQEKRVIVKLNWATGLFDFLNGFIPQDVRAALMSAVPGEKKLILFKRTRHTSVAGHVSDDDSGLASMLGEYFVYNRFVLGYEVQDPADEKKKIKRAVIIDPTGQIDIFTA